MNSLRVYIYKTAAIPDCTLNGISSKYDEAYLIGPKVHGPHNVPEDALMYNDLPVFYLHDQMTNFFGPIHLLWAVANIYKLKDMIAPGATCFGGNFIYCCDSRFTDLNKGNPIKIHDHDEFKRQPYKHPV